MALFRCRTEMAQNARQRLSKPERLLAFKKAAQATCTEGGRPSSETSRWSFWSGWTTGLAGMVILQDCGMRPDEVFPMRIENIRWKQNRIWIPEGKTYNARRYVAMSERMKGMLESWCGSRKEGWVFPSSRSKSGHLTTIAKGFHAGRNRAGLDKKVVAYSARHTYGTYTDGEE